MEFPYEITGVEEKVNEQLLRDFTGERTGFVQVKKEKYFFPKKYEVEGPLFYNFEPRPDDIWVMSYPRSGTTWTQELTWMIANDLDYETASKLMLDQRFPFLEFSTFVHDDIRAEILNAYPDKVDLFDIVTAPGYKTLAEMTSARFVKTHMPFSLLNPKLLEVGSKVIYVARNPKDVAVSFYHLNRLIKTQGYTGDFSKYWDYFEKGLHAWAPYWSHIQEGWDNRKHPNVLFLFYEEMVKDLKTTIRKVSDFLGKTMTEDQIAKLTKHLSIDSFRSNPSVNWDPLRECGLLVEGEQSFVRKGTAGSWKTMFTPELNRRADNWINKNLEKTDLQFPSL